MERLHHPPDTRIITAPSGRRRLLVDLHPTDMRRFVRAVRNVPQRPEVSWPDWLRSTQRASTRPGWVVVRTDIRRCYRSIRPVAVDAGLQAASVRPEDREGVTTFLEATSGAGIEGLPIGPGPSAVLADAVLKIADLAVRHEGAACLRWVDDVVIAGEPSRVLRAYRAWHAVIGDLGLEEHHGKHTETPMAWPGLASLVPALPHAMMPRP